MRPVFRYIFFHIQRKILDRCSSVTLYLMVTGNPPLPPLPQVFTVTKMGFALDPCFLALKMYYRLRMYVPVKINLATHRYKSIHIHTHFHVRLQSVAFKRSFPHIFLSLQCIFYRISPWHNYCIMSLLLCS